MTFKCLKFDRRGTFLARLTLKDSTTHIFFGKIDDKSNMLQLELGENASNLRTEAQGLIISS